MSRVARNVLQKLMEEIKKILLLFLSESQIKTLKRKILGRSKLFRHRQLMARYKKHLYEFGFYERALEDLNYYYNSLNKKRFKLEVAWELALWHSNQFTEEDARKALEYLNELLDQKNKFIKPATIVAAECLHFLKREEEAKQLINRALEVEIHPDLYLAMANLEINRDERLDWINKAYNFYNLEPISFKDSDELSYKDLQMKNDIRLINSDILVSIIIPAYNAENEIDIAIQSLLQQTWKNIEIIVVDDCSTDKTRETVMQYMEVDSRIKLLSTPINSGPYVARNIGLKAANGEFVTINDADDWSHSQKIEIQVNHLLKNNHVIANTSEHARVTKYLNFYRRGTPGRYIFSNMSSLMFRRKEVLKNIGYWDSVRFAGDGEFKRRLIRKFGKKKVIDLQTGPLSLPKQSVSSLTGSSAFGYHGYFKGARKEYVDSMEIYHESGKRLYYEYPMIKRPFPIPEPMRPKRQVDKNGYRYFDSIIVYDFRIINKEVIKKIEKLIKLNKKLGVVHLYSYGLEKEEIDLKYRIILEENDIDLIVYGEKIKTNEVYLLTLNVYEEYQAYVPHIITKNIFILDKDFTSNSNEMQYIKNINKHIVTQKNWYTNNENVKTMFQQIGISIYNLD